MLKSKYLLPAKFKKFGWLLLLPSSVSGVMYMFDAFNPEILDFNVFAITFDGFADNRELFGFIGNNIVDEILALCIISSGLIVAFSKENDEDELISSVRLKCLVWAMYWNYGLLTVALIFFYEFSFLRFMVINMFTPLILFIVRFNWVMMMLRKSLKHEE
ncbi:MAG: hypothetical protein RJQ14_19860 [Marinoscillum sp.]